MLLLQLLLLLLLLLLLYHFVNMLLIVCIPRDIEYGDLLANNHLILKMLQMLKVMTEAYKKIIKMYYE
jgi:hypothetical protein